MMGRRTVLGILAGAATAALTGCGLFMSSASFRYRMTVEGSVSGAAVYEVLAEKVNGPRLADEKPGGSIIKGEALVIETTSGPVFVLLKEAENGSELKKAIMQALASDVPLSEEPYSYAVARHLSGSGDGDVKAELPREQWPMMVRFRDLGDPKTVERVEPATVGVTRILLETTDDAVTTGIEKRMPAWFQQLTLSGARLDGDNSIAVSANPSTVAGQFSPGDFSTIYNGGK